MPRAVGFRARSATTYCRLTDLWLQDKDVAFLSFLAKNPSEMLTNYMGNPLMQQFFEDRRCWFIYRLMEGIFVEQGTINLGVLAGGSSRRCQIALPWASKRHHSTRILVVGGWPTLT